MNPRVILSVLGRLATDSNESAPASVGALFRVPGYYVAMESEPVELTFYKEPAGMVDRALGLVAPGQRLVPGMKIPVHDVDEYGEPGKLLAEAEVQAVHKTHVDFTFRPVE